jgi:hypothetical protein
MSNNGNGPERDLYGRPWGEYAFYGALIAIALAIACATLWWFVFRHSAGAPARTPAAHASVHAPRRLAAAPHRAALMHCPESAKAAEERAMHAALIAQAHAEVAAAKLSPREKQAADAAIDAKPEGDATAWNGTTVTRIWKLALPGRVGRSVFSASRKCVCRVWGKAKIAPLAPPPRKPAPRVRRHAVLRPAPRARTRNCFAYHLDGRGELPQYAATQPSGEPYPRVRTPLEVEMLFYMDGAHTRRMLEADPCFHAEDNVTHAQLRLSHDCSFCEPGDRQIAWPADIPAGTETDALYSIYSADGARAGCPSGDCTVYVPRWVMSSLWCFATGRYYDRRHWHYDGYSFGVTAHAVEEDLEAGRSVYREPVRPLGVFGWNE